MSSVFRVEVCDPNDNGSLPFIFVDIELAALGSKNKFSRHSGLLGHLPPAVSCVIVVGVLYSVHFKRYFRLP